MSATQIVISQKSQSRDIARIYKNSISMNVKLSAGSNKSRKNESQKKPQFSEAFLRGVSGGSGVFGPSGFGVTTVSGFPGSSIRTIYW